MLDVLSLNGNLTKGASSGKLLKGMASETLGVATCKTSSSLTYHVDGLLLRKVSDLVYIVQ